MEMAIFVSDISGSQYPLLLGNAVDPGMGGCTSSNDNNTGTCSLNEGEIIVRRVQ